MQQPGTALDSVPCWRGTVAKQHAKASFVRERAIHLSDDTVEVGIAMGAEGLDNRADRLDGRWRRRTMNGGRARRGGALEILSAKADLIKWSFLFWIGHAAAITALIRIVG